MDTMFSFDSQVFEIIQKWILTLIYISVQYIYSIGIYNIQSEFN